MASRASATVAVQVAEALIATRKIACKLRAIDIEMYYNGYIKLRYNISKKRLSFSSILTRSMLLLTFTGYLSLSIPDEISVKGTVVDFAGRPVSGVTICVWPSDMAIKAPDSASKIVSEREHCTKTGRKGTYSLTLPDSSNVTIIGKRDNLQFIHRINGPIQSETILDTLSHSGALHFFVRKELARSHNDVTVALKGTPFFSLSDKNGQISLASVPAANYSAFIISCKSGYQDIACSLHIESGISDTFPDTLWLSKIAVAETESDKKQPQPVSHPVVKDTTGKEQKKPVLQIIKQITDTPDVKKVEKSREKPKVFAGKDTTVGIKDQFKLKGTATIKDGRIVLKEWAIGKKPFFTTDDGVLPLIAPVTATTLQCVFRATADNDSFATDTITIRVLSSPPVLQVRGESVAGLFDTIHLYGKAADNGSIISTAWDIGNTGQFTPTQDTIFRVPPFDNPPSNITCVFRAIDDDGEMSFDTLKVRLEPLWKTVDIQSKIPPRKGHAMVRFKGNLFVIGGNRCDIWKTSDLEEWQQVIDSADFGSRFGHSVTAYKGNLFVIGGKSSEDSFASDIWQSSDGVTWRKVLEADFLKRHYHTVTEFNNRLWLIGGLGESQYESCLNDIWSSEDGKTWRPEMDVAPFSRRYGHGTFVVNNSLLVTGGMYDGFTGSKYLYDTWSSNDGVNWTQVSEKMFNHDSLFFTYVQNGDRLWALGDFRKQVEKNKPFSVISSSGNGILWNDRISNRPVYSRVFCAAADFNNKILVYPSDSHDIYILK